MHITLVVWQVSSPQELYLLPVYEHHKVADLAVVQGGFTCIAH